MAYLAGDGIYRDRESYPLPDLVLLDLAMPKMSGVEVLKWIRDQSIVRKTRVLIFTSSESPEDFHIANKIGADGYLLKPTKFDDLKKLVQQIHEEWLGKKKNVKAGSRRDKAEADPNLSTSRAVPGGAGVALGSVASV
jgi:DNA-binding NarL/FixJ family response regulator